MTNKFTNLVDNNYFLATLITSGIVFMLLFFSLKSYGYFSFTIYILIGIALYIFTKSRTESFGFIEADFKVVKILLILFFIFYSMSLIELQHFENPYSKSILYFLLIGICMVIVYIISLIKTSWNKYLYIILLFILASNLFLSNNIVFNYNVYCSQDSHYQIYKMVLPIFESGYIPVNEMYTYFPLHQVFISIFSLILNQNPIHLYLVCTGMLYSLYVFFIYLICNRTIGSKFATICILLYMVTPEIVYNANHSYQFSYALPIGIMALFALILYSVDINKSSFSLISNKQSWVVVLILFLFTVIWTHHFTSMFILILFVLTSLIFFLFKKNTLFYNVLVLYIIIMLAHWIYLSSLLSTMSHVIDTYYYSFLNMENIGHTASNAQNAIEKSFVSQFLDASAKGIILMLSSIGSLYLIRVKNIYGYIFAFLGIFLWIFLSVGNFMSIPLLMGGRIISFFWMVFAIYTAAVGGMFLVNRFEYKGVFFLCILFLIIPILGAGSTSAGEETSLFLGEQAYYKFYDNDRDVRSNSWLTYNTPLNSTIYVNEVWRFYYSDQLRIYNEFELDESYNINMSHNSKGYILLSKQYLNGFRVRRITEIEQTQLVIQGNAVSKDASKLYLQLIKLAPTEIIKVKLANDCVYSNGYNYICMSH